MSVYPETLLMQFHAHYSHVFVVQNVKNEQCTFKMHICTGCTVRKAFSIWSCSIVEVLVFLTTGAYSNQ